MAPQWTQHVPNDKITSGTPSSHAKPCSSFCHKGALQAESATILIGSFFYDNLQEISASLQR